MRGVQIGMLYKILGKFDTNGFVNTDIPEVDETSYCLVDLTMLWHQQMGQIGEKGLCAMHSKDMDEGFHDCSFEFDLCEHCVYGKQNHVKFPSRATRDKGIMELVHSDMFGPILIPSLGGSLYYGSIINDFSKKMWLCFLRKKSKVFEKFKEFKTIVENQTKNKIKVLRTNNGGEFFGKEFDQF